MTSELASRVYFWRRFGCLDGVIQLWTGHLCDGERHCEANEDEQCISIGWTRGERDRDALAVVQVGWPEFRCLTPLCFDSDTNSLGPLEAHMICQQLRFATYASFGAVSRTENDSTVSSLQFFLLLPSTGD